MTKSDDVCACCKEEITDDSTDWEWIHKRKGSYWLCKDCRDDQVSTWGALWE
jgi:hypothetical protein